MPVPRFPFYAAVTILAASAAAWPQNAPVPVPADLNGDGKSDLVWVNYATGACGAWLMDGTTTMANLDFPNLPDPNLWLAAVADFNGDGRADLVWRNMQTGANFIWVMDGTALAQTLMLPPQPDLAWVLSGAADFNGDGQPDLVWRNYKSGENMIWLMNGLSITATVTLPAVKDAKWTIEAAGDFNGDGKADVLWRNIWTGQNGAWLMDGTDISVNTDKLPVVTDPNWRITGNSFQGPDGRVGIVWRNYLSGGNFVQYLDWTHGTDSMHPTDSKQLLDAGRDTNWQIVDPVGYDTRELMSTDELNILTMESTTLAPGGGGYNAYNASGFSFLYTMSGRVVLRYPRRAESSAMFQFKKQDLEKQVLGGRITLEAQERMNGGYRAYDPETGRDALFTGSGMKVFVFSDDTWY